LPIRGKSLPPTLAIRGAKGPPPESGVASEPVQDVSDADGARARFCDGRECAGRWLGVELLSRLEARRQSLDILAAANREMRKEDGQLACGGSEAWSAASDIRHSNPEFRRQRRVVPRAHPGKLGESSDVA